MELPDDGLEYKVLHTPGVLTVSTLHPLHGRWWEALFAMCVAADDGDGAVWDAAWAALRRVAFERDAAVVKERVAALVETTRLTSDVALEIAERACLAEEGWTQGAAMYALHFAHAAMDRERPPAGALGGLTPASVARACTNGLVRRSGYRGFGLWEYDGGFTLHNAVVRYTGVPVDVLLAGVNVYNNLPLFLPDTDQRAAIKARVMQPHE